MGASVLGLTEGLFAVPGPAGLHSLEQSFRGQAFARPDGSVQGGVARPQGLHRPGAAEWTCRGTKEPYNEEFGRVFCTL